MPRKGEGEGEGEGRGRGIGSESGKGLKNASVLHLTHSDGKDAGKRRGRGRVGDVQVARESWKRERESPSPPARKPARPPAILPCITALTSASPLEVS